MVFLIWLAINTIFSFVRLCGISIDNTHLFWYWELRCLTYFQSEAKGLRKRLSFGFMPLSIKTNSRNELEKNRKRPMNGGSNELSVVCCRQPPWESCHQRNETGKVFHFNTRIWRPKLPNSFIIFLVFRTLRYKRIKLRQMTIGRDDMESSSTKRLMKWKQRPNPKCECDQSICYGSWLFIALGHLNPFPICELRAIVLKRNVQSQWPN